MMTKLPANLARWPNADLLNLTRDELKKHVPETHPLHPHLTQLLFPPHPRRLHEVANQTHHPRLPRHDSGD